MDKLKMMSMDGTQNNIAKIKALFPDVVTEVIKRGKVKYAIDFDMLKANLSDDIVEGDTECYQFTWPDKKKSIRLANSPVSATLRPCKEESVDFDKTQNLYIEGDNLDVLKLLQETYLGKVKMIYIDPPYNTGNDFVYKDNFAQSADEYKANSGQYDEQGNRLFQNTERNGKFHTDWLNMMYPRLKLAKDLLTEDGVIFISIDENELANVGKMCDDIFTTNNFVECFVYEKKAAVKGVPPLNMVVGVHEYIYVYCKNVAKFRFLGTKRKAEGFSNKDNDQRGMWRNTNLKSTISEIKYTITDPQTNISYTDTWAFSQSEMEKLIKEGRVIFPKNPKGQVRMKEFFNEFDNENIPIKSYLGLFDAQWNTQMITNLMGGKFFLNPKHLLLMKYIINVSIKDSDIILDLFSGSATTAHAVMQLNAEDGGNRKFIMVQLPELCAEDSDAYKAGYKNICEIGKERIRRAGKKIKEDRNIKMGLDKNNLIQRKQLDDGTFEDKYDIEIMPCTDDNILDNLDTGFRVLKLDSSNMKDVYYRADAVKQDLFNDLADNIKEDRMPEDLLFQVMLDMGVNLSVKIETKFIADKKVFFVDNAVLIACFDEKLNEQVITEIAKMKPMYAVFRDSGFESDSVAANFDQIFDTYSRDTQRKVL